MTPKVVLWSPQQHTCTYTERMEEEGGKRGGRKEKRDKEGRGGRKEASKEARKNKKGEGEERRGRGEQQRDEGRKIESLALWFKAQKMSSGKECLKQELLS